jgi:peroxiredoxin Q/BCP
VSALKRIGAAVAALLTAGSAQAAGLRVGDKAPDFALAGSDGREHQLADYVGKQRVVLAWFPKAFTPG